MTPQEQLDYERQIAEILAIRHSREHTPSALSAWLNSTVIATLVGVAGTGLLGAWVSGVIQDRNKKNELARAAQEQRLSAQNVVVNKILNLVGKSMSSADDLLVTVNNAYSEVGRSRHDVDLLRKWKVQLAESRDAADSEWRREKRSLGYTVLYLFDSDPTVNGAWRTVTGKADDFERCTNRWYTENAAHGTTLAVDQICPDDRRAFVDAVEKFMVVVTGRRGGSE